MVDKIENSDKIVVRIFLFGCYITTNALKFTYGSWMNMQNIFLLLFILLRPFYVRMSGHVQPADGLLMAYFLCTLVKDIKAHKLVSNLRRDVFLYVFLLSAIGINLIYFLYVPNKRFLMSSLYLLYMGIVVYSYHSGINRKLIDQIRYVLYAGIIIQFLMWAFGVGNVFYETWEEGATRYMGSFTDPNQLGFFVFIVITYAYLTKNRKVDYVLFPVSLVLGIYLVLLSKSLAVLLGISVLLALIVIRFLFEKCKINRIILASGLVLLTLGTVRYFTPSRDFSIENVEYTTVNRIRYKMHTLIYADGIQYVLRERAAEKILTYPEYFAYGAGEGNYERYYPDPVNEIHSSFINLFYSYGIIPFSFLVIWLYKGLRNINRTVVICLITILVESTFLVNYRQALFWITWLTMFYLCGSEESETVID